MEEKITHDTNLSDEELKYNLLKFIHKDSSKSGCSQFQIAGTIPRPEGGKKYEPISKRNNFLVFDNDEEIILKIKVATLLQELVRDGWIISDPQSQSYGNFYRITLKGKEKFEAGEFDDMQEINLEFIDDTIKLLPNNFLKEYFKEVYICYNDKRLRLSPVFLLGAISEGVISDLINEFDKAIQRLGLSSPNWKESIATRYKQFIEFYKQNKIKDKINSKIRLSSKENIQLLELENYCTFFFNIYSSLTI